ncbi:MAG: Fe-S cluster assembly ATPase SufC [Candidatus Gracilibacteria bacterium]|nr:Fe-S cluster assembly ATPase SufC [Candidatus Gracilibacteria bacterium]
MLEIKNLGIKVGDTQILKGVDMTFETGKNYLLLGKNGSGKSSISNFLMGNPKYEKEFGEVLLDGKDLTILEADERSKAGIFLSFQNVPEIPGVNLKDYLRIIYNNHLKSTNSDIKPLTPFVFSRFIKKYLEELKIDEKFLSRDLNVGFSGGEKRKIEILQVKLLNPKYIILDEIDSGLDLDAFKTVAKLVGELSNENNSIIVITHHFKIADYLNFDRVYVLKNGLLDKAGDTKLLDEIMNNGFGE